MFGRLRHFFLNRFSQPAYNRPIYRAIAKNRTLRLLEIGIGSAERARRMLELARQAAGAQATVEFAGSDRFEDRAAGAAGGLSLKEAYRKLSPLAKVRLLPGDPYSALQRSANALGAFDLLVVSWEPDAATLSRAWLYVPRLMHANSRVFVEERDSPGAEIRVRELPRAEVDRLATTTRIRRAA